MRQSTAVERFEVSSDGATLVGERSGSGPPALLLHGGPGLSDYLAPLAQELDAVCATIRYTQRGLPPSSTEGPFSVDDHVADAIAVLDGLGLERAWVMGHSWGGHLALHIAVSAPASTAALNGGR